MAPLFPLLGEGEERKSRISPFRLSLVKSSRGALEGRGDTVGVVGRVEGDSSTKSITSALPLRGDTELTTFLELGELGGRLAEEEAPFLELPELLRGDLGGGGGILLAFLSLRGEAFS